MNEKEEYNAKIKQSSNPHIGIIEVVGIVTNMFRIYSADKLKVLYEVNIYDKTIPPEANKVVYVLKRRCFKGDDVPHIGDKVVLSHKVTKYKNTFDYMSAKITAIIKD